MEVKKITVLVKNADFETYRKLKENNVYPLMVETDIYEMFDDPAYLLQGNNVYILRIQYLKGHYWSRSKQAKGIEFEKDVLEFEDGTKYEILSPVEAYETENNQIGFIVNSPLAKNSFVSLESIMSYINIGNKNATEMIEKVTIHSEIADFHSYEIMRSNNVLPMVVVLTEFQSRIVSVPFDELYTKVSTAHNGKSVMTLNLTLLNKMLIGCKIKLKGIKLEDGKVYKVNKILEGDSDNSLGVLSLEEQEVDIMKYTKKLLEPKELKTSNQVEEYYLY